MFADGYFSFSFPELAGAIITIVGIWLVVRQLYEGKLASQMEGMMAISERFAENNRTNALLVKMVTTDDWDNPSSKEAHTRVFESDPTVTDWSNILLLYELVGVLARRKALDKHLAFDYFGYMITIWWKRLEKVNRQQAIELDVPKIGEHWEWLVGEFEKLDA